ncbi:MAG: helix-turn-helix protein [Alphaproteobacteria bacterium ADurb.Bin438]|nr:MAG: helix-turn-helix protein [Alphaproteobacteria bacterium ADurb.Bin438]
MRNIEDYMNLAKRKQKITSNNKLGEAIGINSNSISMINRGFSLPTDENMIKLAELAGVPLEEAMIDLNIWRAERDNKPKVLNFWQDLAKKIAILSTVFGFISLISFSTKASTTFEYSHKSCNSVRYVYNDILK